MAYVCPCGDNPTVHITVDELITYCQSCGSETKQPRPKEVSIQREPPIVSLSRASILKKINNTIEEEPKRPKQIRDRNNYVPQRGGRR